MAANPNDLDQDYVDWVMSFYLRPLDAVLAWYSWGEGDLKGHDGPDVWQTQVLARLQRRLLEGKSTIRIGVRSGHGVGKVFANQTPIPTPAGIKRWGDIVPGDLVFGADGSPTLVTARFDHPGHPFYRVSFDDGSSILAGLEHQWAVRGRQDRRNGADGWRVMTTGEILESGVKRPNGTALARQWEIPTQGAAQFEEREIDIHPYLMGVWLGDGSKNISSYCKPYPEVTERIRSFGYDVADRGDGKQKYVRGISHLWNDSVFGCGSHERYIPDDYKFNTVENRMELFRGLCDSDGEVHKSGSIGYASTSRRLIEDVLWLARSLGCKAMLQTAVKSGWYPDPETGERVECRDCYQITINAPFNPFCIPHKRDRFKSSEPRYTKRWIDSIEPECIEDGHCITVAAPDELYQAGDFIVTHNTALIAWIIHWFASTRPNPQIVVTANTKNQLETKTWRELALWKPRVINGDWFEWTATRYKLKGAEDTWYASALPWSKNNPQAFAGTHAVHVLIIFDEASEIDPMIWEVVEGALTTGGAIQLAFGNPSSITGKFAEIFGRMKKYWERFQVDSRNAKMTNKKLIQEWADTYGEDSDFFRVRVKGLPPHQGAKSLVSRLLCNQALERDIPVAHVSQSSPLLMGVDVAKDGDDDSVIIMRKGQKVHPDIRVMKQRDLMGLASTIAMMINTYRPDVVFVDAVGIGAGVVDRLVQLGHDCVVGVKSGERADDPETFYNRRTEMWFRMSQWIADADIPSNDKMIADRLIDELCGPEIHYDRKDLLRLEKKEEMARRGVSSPDIADALANTFSHLSPVKRDQYEGETEPECP